MSTSTAEPDRSGDRASTVVAGDATELLDPRLAHHVVDLRARLRPSCQGWDAAAFEALVLSMARTKVRWADIESHT